LSITIKYSQTERGLEMGPFNDRASQ